MLPQELRNRAVVAVNEYPPGKLPVGHVNLTFYFHGVDQGTLGRNSQGMDIAGRYHPQKPWLGDIPGGVFKEPDKGAMTHYVVVSDKNYKSMFAFAQSQAQLTLTNKVSYNFLAGNCADFIYQVFQHSDLPQQYRRIAIYLRNKTEPVAIYAEDDAINYEDAMKSHPRVARTISGIRIYQELTAAGALIP